MGARSCSAWEEEGSQAPLSLLGGQKPIRIESSLGVVKIQMPAERLWRGKGKCFLFLEKSWMGKMPFFNPKRRQGILLLGGMGLSSPFMINGKHEEEEETSSGLPFSPPSQEDLFGGGVAPWGFQPCGHHPAHFSLCQCPHWAC